MNKDEKSKFSVKQPRTIITGTWDISKTDNTKEVLIRGEVTLYGKTDCYSLMFEDENSHLTINAGARLRVWEGGIVNNDCGSVNYLTIVEDAVNDEYGEFLLHPDVTVNNHPLASIKLISKSYMSNGTNVFQRFTTPAVNIFSMESGDPNTRTRVWYYNTTTDSWTEYGNLGEFDVNLLTPPFAGYQMINYRSTPGIIYTFVSNIIGNSNYTHNLLLHWNLIMCSYSSRISNYALLSYVSKIGLKLYTLDGINITENNISQYPFIKPIFDTYEIYNTDNVATSIALSYKDLVWDPSFEEDVTSTCSLMNEILTTAKPMEIDTTLEGSAIFDNPVLVFPHENDER